MVTFQPWDYQYSTMTRPVEAMASAAEWRTRHGVDGPVVSRLPLRVAHARLLLEGAR